MISFCTSVAPSQDAQRPDLAVAMLDHRAQADAEPKLPASAKKRDTQVEFTGSPFPLAS
jgi:hypothetical protein